MDFQIKISTINRISERSEPPDRREGVIRISFENLFLVQLLTQLSPKTKKFQISSLRSPSLRSAFQFVFN